MLIKIKVFIKMIYDLPYLLYLFFVSTIYLLKLNRYERLDLLKSWKMFDYISKLFKNNEYLEHHINIATWGLILFFIWY